MHKLTQAEKNALLAPLDNSIVLPPKHMQALRDSINNSDIEEIQRVLKEGLLVLSLGIPLMRQDDQESFQSSYEDRHIEVAKSFLQTNDTIFDNVTQAVRERFCINPPQHNRHNPLKEPMNQVREAIETLEPLFAITGKQEIKLGCALSSLLSEGLFPSITLRLGEENRIFCSTVTEGRRCDVSTSYSEVQCPQALQDDGMVFNVQDFKNYSS